MPAQRPEMTVDELIATLKHSHLPTLIVEGDDDVIVFRRLEERAPNLSLSVLPAGGRPKLLQLFDRIAEVGNKKLFFIADLDLWVLSGPPNEYISNKLVFTDGYSIENDAFLDTNAIDLLDQSERAVFRDELNTFVSWYALAVDRHLKDATKSFKNNPNEILHDQQHRDLLMRLEENETYPTELHGQLADDPYRLVRGKSVIQVFMRQMKAQRPAKHSVYTMLELAAVQPKERISRLFEAARTALQ